MDFSSTGAMRSPFSPRVRQSITGRRPMGISSAKKNQSKYMHSPIEQAGDVVYKTPLTTIETYGMPLPVMVTEALTFASGEVSVRLSPCGWCWVVSGRRVVSWPRTPAHSSASSPAPASTIARELTLPQTDLSHKADLVVLFYEDGAQMPSCIGVSPEGTVRYWPSVGQEGVYVDVSCELAGQECEKLGEYTQEGLVLATTTCTVVLLNPTVVDGRATVTCRTLRPPSGWLGGIGRRVSLLFFGSMPAHADTKLVGVVVLPGNGESESTIALVSGGPALQLWRGAELHEHPLRRPLTEAYARTHLAPHGDLNSLEIMALDVRASGNNGLLLLIATVNVARSPEMRYAIAHVSVEELSAVRVVSLAAARGWGECDEPPRFLPLPHRALLYTSKYIAIVSTTVSNEKVEYIDVSLEGDRLACAELCGGTALLFSHKHGVLALTQHAHHAAAEPSMCESPMGSPCPSDMYDGNLSLYEIDPHEVSMVTTDACGKLKTAFLFHVRRDGVACRAIIDELFPAGGERDARDERDVDSLLDRSVLRIATEMLDDIPAGDPRWKQRGGGATNISLGSSAALQVAAQLRDKQRAFSLFCDFLRATGLWQRLQLVTRGNHIVQHQPGQLGGPAGGGTAARQAARLLALLRLPARHRPVAAPAARHQRGRRRAEHGAGAGRAGGAAGGGGGAAPAAARGRRAAHRRRHLPGGVRRAPRGGGRAGGRGSAVLRRAVPGRRVLPPRVARDARAARAGRRHAPRARRARRRPARRRHAQHTHQRAGRGAGGARGVGEGAGGAGGGAPPAPQLGPRALLPKLAQLHKRALTQCAHNCPDPTLRAQVYEAAASLADLILTDAEHLNSSSHTQHMYEKIRREAIQPFIDEGQTERAAALAEKFKDFELLIEMCVTNDDWDKLYSYFDKYSNEGIAAVTFARLYDGDGPRRGALLRRVGARAPHELRAWLGAAPGARAAALHELGTRLRARAAALRAAAGAERQSVRRLAPPPRWPLCLAAAPEPEPAAAPALHALQALAAHHAALPAALRAHHGLAGPDSRVLPPADLVQMYIDSDSKTLTEYDYKKALDLTDFIEDMELRDDLRLRVWCACIRNDDWSACRVSEPAEELRDKMFFRLIDLVHVMGGDLDLLLPPVEDILTAPELAELVSDPRFHFIMKYGYECVDTTRLESMAEG
ncbi:unnamed protein product [Chrysodeixis includens]|uniref:Nucleoporin Nup133/Nup155-like N-terminal domain-containing protein n=1 Tax=Chrysodeixis includens TaxID=689277 RepID=A0A9P0BVB6_CHRIL|nr:unnamed protein product [Chrysodeixis includens]